jgi:hypothetical protein
MKKKKEVSNVYNNKEVCLNGKQQHNIIEEDDDKLLANTKISKLPP